MILSSRVSKRFTPAELEDFQAFFCKLPTYKADGDVEGYAQSTEVYQLGSYADYGTYAELTNFEEHLDKQNGGRFTCSHFMEIMKTLHDTVELSRTHANEIDKDRNGFISQDEFEELLNIATFREDKLKGVTFADFVREADANKDGKVSIDECAAWMAKQL